MIYTTTLSGIELAIEHCYNCSCVFAMDKKMNDRLRETHEEFWCPNGHGQYYLSKTENEELREKLHSERVKNMNLEEQKRRTEQRVHAGQCPFCGQHLRDLARHVKRQHKGRGL